MEVHLFSSTGEPPLQNIVDVSLSSLRSQRNPVVLYLPPTYRDEYVELTRQKFSNVAKVNAIDLTKVSSKYLEQALEEASFLFIPGGNTYLLNYRLHCLGVVKKIRERIKTGLPYAGMSAGTLICGANILTTSDVNCCGSTFFEGFGLTAYNFVAHYPDLDLERVKVDDRIFAYHRFHENPVIALKDDAYIQITKKGLNVKRGDCWLFERDKERIQINRGDIL
jgi:peptidase E